MIENFDLLSWRAGFNSALRHFRVATEFAKQITNGHNLADLINTALNNETIANSQIAPMMNVLLVDKFSYSFSSTNFVKTINNVSKVVESFQKWTGIQVVFCYEHPQTGLFLINPKKMESFEPALPILRDELGVIYCGALSNQSPDILSKAVADSIKILSGNTVKAHPQYIAKQGGAARKTPVAPAAAVQKVQKPVIAASKAQQTPPQKKPAPASPPSVGGKRRMTPRYSVVVTNELFHNGNVEAWKRIIASYCAKHVTLDVLIWYDNERINDINALFKWGKVKHGTPIMVSVVGSNIKDVSKLQRYLYEGASPRFEMFLKGSIDQPLELF